MDEPNNEMTPPENKSEEELRLENDIMKLKLQAEFGAQFDEIAEDVSPEMEQQFLQQVYDFEKAWQNQQVMTVADLIGQPQFIPLTEIAEDALQQAWETAMGIYTEKNISVDFIHDYPLTEKYRFITEELPLHETMFVNMPGMMLGFIYEEFHPNYAADMEEQVKKFMESWFQRDTEKCLELVSKQLILEDGHFLELEDLEKKLQYFFDSFKELEESEFFISETSYDKQEDADELLMLGYVAGGIHCNAILENGEKIACDGPFKFYLEYVADKWSIMYFVLPGWKW